MYLLFLYLTFLLRPAPDPWNVIYPKPINMDTSNCYREIIAETSKDFKQNKNQYYTVGIEALNILNKNYEIIKNYPMAGRTIRLYLTMNF